MLKGVGSDSSVEDGGNRSLCGHRVDSDPASTRSTSPATDETLANGALALINVASALLGRQIEAQAAAFERDGGFTERLYATRQARRRAP